MDGDVTFSDQKFMKQFAVCYVGRLLQQDFMADKPNSNSIVADAISVQCSALINYIFIILNAPEKDFLSKIQTPMTLRSALETVANINYFAGHQSKTELSNKYLASAHETHKALVCFLNKKPIVAQRWCDISITKRIKALDQADGRSHIDLYYYLSSFVHADAGFEYTFGVEHDALDKLYYGALNILLIDLDSILTSLGLINHNLAVPSVAEALLRREKKKDNPSEEKMEMYETVLRMFQT
jgi:hypothetical protein